MLLIGLSRLVKLSYGDGLIDLFGNPGELEMTKPILELIRERMTFCESYDDRFCDDMICPECSCCDKNLRYEAHKQNRICPKCHGLQIYSSMNPDVLFRSITSECNVCAGTGSFIVSI